MSILRSLFVLLVGAVLAADAFAPSPLMQATRVATQGALKAAESEVDFADLDGEGIRIGIIRTRWNKEYVDKLVDGAKEALKEVGVKDDDIFVTEVPGAFELPMAARFLAMSGTVDAIITTGVLIKGETMHFEYISEAVSSGIMSVGLQTMTPVIFGVLTCMNEQQVADRAGGKSNHGVDWGKTAVEMALLRRDAVGKGKKKGSDSLMAMGIGNGMEDAGDKKEEKERVGFF